jgi:hypothetical protein
VLETGVSKRSFDCQSFALALLTFKLLKQLLQQSRHVHRRRFRLKPALCKFSAALIVLCHLFE